MHMGMIKVKSPKQILTASDFFLTEQIVRQHCYES